MQDWANDPEKDAQAKEQEDSEKEKKVEEDDEETLQKARDWDEWKDGRFNLPEDSQKITHSLQSSISNDCSKMHSFLREAVSIVDI